MAAMAYLFIVPIVVITVLIGVTMALSSKRLWANVPGGVLLFFSYVEVKTMHLDSSMSRISAATTLMAVVGVIIAFYLAWQSSTPTPKWFSDKSATESSNHKEAFLFCIMLQLVAAFLVWILFGMTLTWF